MAAAGPAAAAADALHDYAWSWDGMELSALPELFACTGLLSCSVGWDYYAMVCVRARAVRCLGGNRRFQLGTGDSDPREGFVTTDPPLRQITSVCCAMNFTIALHSSGAVSIWGGRRTVCADACPMYRPVRVSGLPPVAAVNCGLNHILVLTRDDEVYGWGRNTSGALAGLPSATVRRAVRVASLSGRGVRTMAICYQFGVAEAGQQLLWWGIKAGKSGLSDRLPAPLSCDPRMAFPLRSLAAGVAAGRREDDVLLRAAAADAEGTLWFCSVYTNKSACRRPQRADLGGQQAVKVVAAVETSYGRKDEWALTRMVALTADGALWDVSDPEACLNIRAASSLLPLGLVPYGGAAARHVLLLPTRCGGRRRLGLFGRIAMRLEVPSDCVREVLCPLVVHQDYITGPPFDPFGPPVARR